MGMDICGRNPTGEPGQYFRNNVWWWHPLADYCTTVAPDICAACRYWHSNDRDGLDAADAFALAEALQREIDAGRTETYARRYASDQELMPDEPCNICAGTGMRTPRPHRGADALKEGGIKCNKCQGAGYVRPWASHYPFSTENVAAFAAFLRESGGFSILLSLKPRRRTMSDDRMKEEIVANCVAAGQAVDIDTCEVRWSTCNVADH